MGKLKLIFIGVFIGLVTAGVLLGVFWFEPAKPNDVQLPHLEHLIKNSNITISEDRWGCENISEKSLAGVLSYMNAANINQVRSRLKHGCLDGSCNFYLNYCEPWQTSECSTLFLRYEVSDDGLPDIETVNCILM